MYIFFSIETSKVVAHILSIVFLVFTSLLICLDVDFFEFILFSELQSVGLCVREFLAIISLNTFSSPHSFSPSRTLMTHMLDL